MPGPHCLLYKYTIYSYGRGEANTLRWLHAWLQTNEIFTSPDLTKPAEQQLTLSASGGVGSFEACKLMQVGRQTL